MGPRHGSRLAAGLALAMVVSVASQSLTEMAEREKQRREAMRSRGPSRSFSDQNLAANVPGWHWFGGKAYGFHAYFPASPQVEDETDIVGALRIPRRRYVAAAAGYVYSVLVKARPNDVDLTNETLLNRLQAEARVDSAGEIMASNRLAGQPCPGVEFSAKAQRAGKQRRILYRAFACSKQLLTVAAECCASESEGELELSPPGASAASHFLEYFVLEEW